MASDYSKDYALSGFVAAAQSPATGGAINIDHSVVGKLVKSPTSKKTLTLRDYVEYYSANKTMLILQHNNLTQSQLLKIRAELNALPATLRVLRVGIFSHAVKVANLQSSPAGQEWRDKDVNLHAVSVAAKNRRREQGLDLTQLLSGPICAITFPPATAASSANTLHSTTSASSSVEPATLKKVLGIVQRTQNKLMLLGGKFESQVFAVDALDRVAALPGIDVLRGQLLSLLGSPAVRLSQLLGSPAQTLDRTMQGYELSLKGPEDQKES